MQKLAHDAASPVLVSEESTVQPQQKSNATSPQRDDDEFSDSTSDDSDSPLNETDPTLVDQPVIDLVHKNLTNAWRLHPQHQMCYIFDFVTPARQWKRGTRYTEDDPRATYGPAPWPDLTETDENGGLQSYYPREFQWVTFNYLIIWDLNFIDDSLKYEFQYSKITQEKFLNWKTGELKHIEVITHIKSQNKNRARKQSKVLKIPFIYVQLIAQLNAENEHGDLDQGHEAVRRQSYARQILDHVARELKGYRGPGAAFHSKVLNPILQRYLQGVADSYTPCVRAGISGLNKEPTISDVTKFYLSMDPTDPKHIRQYR